MRPKKLDKRTFTAVALVSGSFVLVFSLVCVILALILGGGREEEKGEKAEYLDEMNGVWIASISNIDFPSKPDLTKDELCRELDSIVENVAGAGLDTIFFQVRPSSDALYRSDIFPVSRYLSSDGKLTLDTLDYLIKAAKKKDIKVHAWINPLRVAVGGTVEDLSAKNPGRKNPSWCVKYSDGKIYYDCGLPEVRSLVAEGVREIVENYDVAGVVFDDYFYPYPQYETDKDGNRVAAVFEDSSTFDSHGSAYDDIGDWRRDNVNALIKLCYDTVKEADKDCIFGVSPFGIWKNGYGDESGSATRGSQSYFDIYCDTLAWVEGGYVDYIAPQLYWTDDNSAASYGVLTQWWAQMLEEKNVTLLVSHAAYRYSEWESPEGIITSQIKDARKYGMYRGSIFYGYEEIKNNAFGITEEIKKIYTEKDGE